MAAGRLTRPRRVADDILAAIITVLWAASLLPLFSFAAADKRLLEGFSIDELIQLNLLHHAASTPTFAMNFGPYGHLVFNLILIVLRLLPGAVTDARILYVGRGINLIFGAACVLFIFEWSRRVYGRAAAWIAFSLVLVNATLYIGISEVQPDIVQLFFLMLSLGLTVRLAGRPESRWLVLAAATAGLAFACKYSGLFVLPIIAVAVARRPVTLQRPALSLAALRTSLVVCGALLVALSFVFNAGWIAAHLTEDGHIDSPLSAHLLSLLTVATRGGGALAIVLSATPWLWTWLRQRSHVLAVLWSWFLMLATFVATFVITSPYSLRKAAFIKGMMGEAAFAVPATIASQLGVIRGIGTVAGWAATMVALITAAVLLWRLLSKVPLAAVDAVLMAWVVIYTVVLLLPAHEIYLDYALPLVPAIAMLAARGVGLLWQWVSESAPARKMLMAIALALVVLAAEVPLAADLLRARQQQVDRTTTSVQAYVARWLQCRAPASTRIAYDYFVYVPSMFPNVSVTWGGTIEWLAAINPDIVVTEVSTAEYAAVDAEHRVYYECLAAGTCGYERALTRGDLSVYVRKGRRGEVLRESPAQLSARGCS